ncbi:uncharacterized protein LOC133419425 [Cololabis saira]|uniref:uncharacterized protein LOC133419425 n=1 Tax=Cololabis saira TaxID=129043 RepID=UPI002AD415B5|nr:uncharacterized protein LOC133419425 [Cololabis saira]
MVFYYPTKESPMMCLCTALWIFCCHLAKKQRREAAALPHRPSRAPAVYIIPIYEGQEDEQHVHEAYFPPSYRESPAHFSRIASPPPPYMPEPPSYPDPPPSYVDPPPYSEQP